jgi:transcriptional regulator with XRE-family HTH domain
MNSARALRYARRRAGLSQRELAERSGLPQSTVGRIETGAIDPRVSTLDRLLRACEFDLEVEPLLGIGVDRSQIREMLALTPAERLARLGQEAEVFQWQGAAQSAERGARRDRAI